MTHPHPSDLPMIVPARQGSMALISRATGGLRWVKRPYVPAPWTWFPPRPYREKSGHWYRFKGWGADGPKCKWRPDQMKVTFRTWTRFREQTTIQRFQEWNQ